MGKSWTDEQKQAIELSKRSLLVSAAAGSGKTAVLVERIIKKITDADAPIDIDRLLVVTFTKAAASEMRERVMAAIDAKLAVEPENLHLQKQKMLLPSASITTIDSFCMRVLKEHFDAIGLDPGFRVGDPQEIALLKQDVAEKLLEDSYEAASEAFIAFVQTYARGKLDYGLTEWILKIYNFSQSYPWPEQWLEQALRYNPANSEDTQESGITEIILEESRIILKEMEAYLKTALNITREADGPWLYEPMLCHDLEQIRAMQKYTSFDTFSQALYAITWDKLSGKKQPEASEDKKNAVKKLRQNAKDLLKWMKENYFMEAMSVVMANERVILSRLQVFVELTKQFSKRFQEEKRLRNMIDFNDQEHLALQILLDENHEPTEVAKSYRRQFEEIMCDEYQDSNEVQETLLHSISREDEGVPNIFIVGDVKQSIYRFRLAEPQIFLDKYDTFLKTESLHQRIDLRKNFRSRAEVLHGINKIFENLMTQEMCDMTYDSDAALYPGFEYGETEHPTEKRPEWLLVEHEDSKELTKKEAEAKAIGMRIRELLDPEKGIWIFDSDIGDYRKAEYKDVVILLRTVKGWSEDFVRVLKEMGIPAIGDTSSGFFDTIEVQGILNMLRILDNPLQDIPMVAVMTSVLGKFSDEEVTKIRLMDRKKHMYEDICLYIEQGEETYLRDKLELFMAWYEALRKLKVHRSIEELIYEIYEQTGYIEAMEAMPGGALRKANLNRLLEYAKDFKKTSYQGLFDFIRYIDQLKEAKEDVGEAVLLGDSMQCVRVMSIHKSKGLEYPICFVAGIAKTMNLMDVRSRIVIHSKYGIAADATDLEKRTKIHSLSRRMIARKLLREQLAEEIRVLYVAMTRAREKLILTGVVETVEKTEKAWEYRQWMERPLTYTQMMKAQSYLDWLGPILTADAQYGKTLGFDFRRITLEQLAQNEIFDEIQEDIHREGLEAYRVPLPENASFHAMIKEHLQWNYPNEWMTHLQGKMTVSELKKMAGEAMLGNVLYPEDKSKPPMEDAEVKLAQQKGTATHKIFECIPFNAIHTEAEVRQFIRTCVEKEMLPKFWEDLIEVDKVYRFIRSELGVRMAKAQEAGRLYRERPFVMGIPICDIYPEKALKTQERLLIQGVIDVYFEEADGVVLVDYKTDRVPNGEIGEKILIKRYKTQLDYYQKAIEGITGKRVKEKILYSVTMGKEIHCE